MCAADVCILVLADSHGRRLTSLYLFLTMLAGSMANDLGMWWCIERLTFLNSSPSPALLESGWISLLYLLEMSLAATSVTPHSMASNSAS